MQSSNYCNINYIDLSDFAKIAIDKRQQLTNIHAGNINMHYRFALREYNKYMHFSIYTVNSFIIYSESYLK